MGTYSNPPLEKVIIVELDCLTEIMFDLPYLLMFDPNDTELPSVVNESAILDNLAPIDFREKRMVDVYKRKCDFRKKVLDAYSSQCAICRCREKKILEAAHILAVKDQGCDDVSNGVCLCANHHKMFDQGLLKINFEKLTIYDVASSVKEMPWYDVFQHNHGGKILPRNI